MPAENPNLSVAHLWETYPPGQYTDAHPFLLNEGVVSRVYAFEALETGADPGQGVWSTRRVPIEGIARVRSLHGLWLRATRRAGWQAFLRSCEKRMRTEPPHVIHAHFGTTAARMMPLVESVGAPLIVSFYGWDATAALTRARWLRLLPPMLRQASLVLVLCDEFRERLVHLGCSPDRIRLHRVPAGVEFYEPHPPRSPDGEVRFLHAARFIEYKGGLVVLDALHKVIQKGYNARLTMMGYGPLRDQLKAHATRLGLDGRVEVIDTRYQADFHQVFDAATRGHDVFLHATYRGDDGVEEGGPPLTLVAAMAGGLPAVTTRFPGCAALIKDGVNAWYVPERDSGSLAEQMSWLIEHPATWAPVGEAGNSVVRAAFSYERQMTELLEIYREVANLDVA